MKSPWWVLLKKNAMKQVETLTVLVRLQKVCVLCVCYRIVTVVWKVAVLAN